MIRPPTARQLEVLAVIADYTEGHGYPPALADLRAALGVSSVHTVVCHLDALRRRGLVESTPRVARSLRLTAAGRRVLS